MSADSFSKSENHRTKTDTPATNPAARYSRSTLDQWKTVIVDPTPSVENLISQLQSRCIRLEDTVVDMLVAMPALTTSLEITIMKVHVFQLGLREPPTTHAIYARASQLGLHLVPAQLGPQLRQEYMDQPDAEYLLLAMTPLSCNCYPHIFVLGTEGGIVSMHAESGYLGHIWDENSCWVFAR